MRRDVCSELMTCNKISGVRRETGRDGAHAHAPAPAALPAHEGHPKKGCVAHKSSGRGAIPFVALLVTKETLALEELVLRACAY
jgi:hypothetical protein